MKITFLALASLFSSFTVMEVGAQSTVRWPERSVKIIVPFAPGGSTDIIARLIGSKLTEEYAQQFLIENRPGAGGTIGAEQAVKASPDGYTFAIVPSSYVTNAALYKLPYHPSKGIAPIAQIVSYPVILVINPMVPANNLREFLELARSKPLSLNIGSPGTGSSPHLVAELFQQKSGTKFVHIPYKGDAPALSDLIAGQIQALFVSGSVALPNLKAGKLRALGVSTVDRSSVLADAPAIGEVIQGFSAGIWIGMFAPVGTSREIVQKVNQSIAKILKIPEFQDRLRSDGTEPAYSSAEDFGRLIDREVKMWSEVVTLGNISLN
jgi:tripartite-type tricarboxylate transporter receptor subunit TctC